MFAIAVLSMTTLCTPDICQLAGCCAVGVVPVDTGFDSSWMPISKPVSALPACPTLLQAVDQVKDRAREGFDASPAPALKDAVSSVREAVPGPRDAARQSSESASNTADQLQEAAQDAGQAVDSVTPDIKPDKQVGSYAALALLAPSGCNQLSPALRFCAPAAPADGACCLVQLAA